MWSSIHFARQQVKSFLLAFGDVRLVAACSQYMALASDLGLALPNLRRHIAIYLAATPV